MVQSHATRVTDRMFLAAARTLSERAPADRLFPDLSEIREVSAAIAHAVAVQAKADGACTEIPSVEEIRGEMWEPQYLPYRPAESVTVMMRAMNPEARKPQ